MKNTLTPVTRRLANTRRLDNSSIFVRAQYSVRRSTMTIECIDRPGVPLGYVLGHVALTMGANSVHKLVPYPSLYVCRIRRCYLSIALGATLALRLDRIGGESQDTCGPRISLVVYFNRRHERAAVREPRPTSLSLSTINVLWHAPVARGR